MYEINTVEPWERQPKESIQAYEAFKIYCGLGEKRSLRKVANELSKSETLIKRWNKNWNWQERCLEYDNELIRKELKEKKKAIENMRKRHIQTAVSLQMKALERLKNLDIEDLNPRDILNFISEGIDLEIKSRFSDTVETDNNKGNTININIVGTKKE